MHEQFDFCWSDVPLPIRRPHNGTPTSRQAAESLSEQRLGADEARIVATVQQHGPLTCDALELRTGLSHQTCSARIRGLVQKQRLRDSGTTARTRSGRVAVCWVAR